MKIMSVKVKEQVKSRKKVKTLKEQFTLESYEGLDENIVGLVKVLNSFQDIYTIGSCGGHKNPKSYQLPNGSWKILFKIEPTARLTDLEFITWSINHMARWKEYGVWLDLHSPPPYLNEIGNSVYFSLNGEDCDARKIAQELEEYKNDDYVPF